MQIITQAIARSKSHTEIVTIRASETECSYEGMVAALKRECEDWTEANDRVEFWGRDVDGTEWRVHVRPD